MSDEAEKLWKKYLRNRSVRAHKALMVFYIPVIAHQVRQYVAQKNLGAGFDSEDLASDGAFGLSAAIKRFDPSRGVKFETYASLAIRGAIMDGIRKRDAVPRCARRRATAMNTARRKFFEKHGYNPGDDELLEWMSVPRNLRDNHLLSQKWAKTQNLEQFTSDSDTDGEQIVMPDDNAENPSASSREGEIREYVLSLLASPELKNIANLYYYEKMTMKEIGDRIGLCETRVSQLHTRIVAIWQSRIRDESLLKP